MFINKIKNNLSIKNLLIASLLISSLAINKNSNASWLIKNKTSINTKTLRSLLAGSACAIAIYIAIKCLNASNRSEDQAGMIDDFNNGRNDFAQLERNARHLYNDKTLLASDESLESDYPAQWLAKDAQSNKRYMRLMGILSQEKSELADRLQNGLNNLNDNELFRQNRRTFNHEDRENKYRNSKLIEGKVRNAGAIADLAGKIKNLFKN